MLQGCCGVAERCYGALYGNLHEGLEEGLKGALRVDRALTKGFYFKTPSKSQSPRRGTWISLLILQTFMFHRSCQCQWKDPEGFNKGILQP